MDCGDGYGVSCTSAIVVWSGFPYEEGVVSFLSSTAGHYVAFAKNSLRNSWYEFNDTRVYPISSDTVLNAEGYVLFYRYDQLYTASFSN
jgi:hypothetical protein